MNKIKELFFGSKQDKLTEKAFTQSITVSVFSILLCLVALCSLTWAWFSDDVSSGVNNIQSAYCDIIASINNHGTTVEPVNSEFIFEKEKVYEITTTASGTAKTTYCILNIDGNTYYTEQIPTTTTEINGETVPIVAEPTQTETPESTENSESTETVFPFPEVTE